MNKAIKKIELDLGGKTVILTPKQAQNLKDALDDLFGKKVIVEREYIHDHTYIPQPYPVLPHRPYYEPVPFWDYRRDLTTCKTNSNYSFDNDTLKLMG